MSITLKGSSLAESGVDSGWMFEVSRPRPVLCIPFALLAILSSRDSSWEASVKGMDSLAWRCLPGICSAGDEDDPEFDKRTFAEAMAHA